MPPTSPARSQPPHTCAVRVGGHAPPPRTGCASRRTIGGRQALALAAAPQAVRAGAAQARSLVCVRLGCSALAHAAHCPAGVAQRHRQPGTRPTTTPTHGSSSLLARALVHVQCALAATPTPPRTGCARSLPLQLELTRTKRCARPMHKRARVCAAKLQRPCSRSACMRCPICAALTVCRHHLRAQRQPGARAHAAVYSGATLGAHLVLLSTTRPFSWSVRCATQLQGNSYTSPCTPSKSSKKLIRHHKNVMSRRNRRRVLYRQSWSLPSSAARASLCGAAVALRDDLQHG